MVHAHRLLKLVKVNGDEEGAKPIKGLYCLLAHKYDSQPVPCTVTVIENSELSAVTAAASSGDWRQDNSDWRRSR